MLRPWALLLALVSLSWPSLVSAQIRVPGLSGTEPDRITIFTVRSGTAMPPLIAFQEKARQVLEEHLDVEIVSMDELLTQRGSLQQDLQKCRGEPKCFADLLRGTVDARYLLIITASANDDLRLLGARLVDLKSLTLVGEEVDEVPGGGNFLDLLPSRIQSSVPPAWWDPFGELILDVSEPGAQVKVNGRIIGMSPVSKLGYLLPGTYQLAATKEGFTDAAASADVHKGVAARASLSLKMLQRPEESSALPWILGIGGAVIAAGAITAVVILSSGGGDPSFCTAPNPALCR